MVRGGDTNVYVCARQGGADLRKGKIRQIVDLGQMRQHQPLHARGGELGAECGARGYGR